MDAVQQANSGHPGTPMAMAPVVYLLWQEFLRFDPEDPIWPNRDRFVLSAGHASTLLYSILHLTGVKAVNRKYETLGELSVRLDDLKNFRQLESRCPGTSRISMDLGSGDNDRTARTGSRDQRRHGPGQPLVGGALQQAKFSSLWIRCLCACWRRLHDGGREWRSRLAGRSPGFVEPLLDLRQQSHHYRRPHQSGFLRRCGGSFPCLRMERGTGVKRQRLGACYGKPSSTSRRPSIGLP